MPAATQGARNTEHATRNTNNHLTRNISIA